MVESRMDGRKDRLDSWEEPVEPSDVSSLEVLQLKRKTEDNGLGLVGWLQYCLIQYSRMAEGTTVFEWYFMLLGCRKLQTDVILYVLYLENKTLGGSTNQTTEKAERDSDTSEQQLKRNKGSTVTGEIEKSNQNLIPVLMLSVQ